MKTQQNKKMKKQTVTPPTPPPPYSIKNGKTFLIKFLPCTNSRGARVKVSFEHHEPRKFPTLTLSWSYEAGNDTYEVAFANFLARHESFFFDRQEGERFDIVKSWTPKGYYFTARVAR